MPGVNAQPLSDQSDPSDSEAAVRAHALTSRTPRPAALLVAERRCPECHEAVPESAMFCPFDGVRLGPVAGAALAGAALAGASLVGATLDGRYEVLSELRSDLAGDVYKVHHLTLSRFFALKLLHEPLARKLAVNERFVADAKAVALMGDPRIARVVDFGVTAAHQPYFATELVDAPTLRSELTRLGRLTLADTLIVVRQVVETLAGVPRPAGFVWAPSPERVALLGDGVPAERKVKLLDFGAVFPSDGGVTLPAASYFSPEQAAGEPLDERADVYSLGVLLFECLTGQVPFMAPTGEEVLLLHRNADPALITQILPIEPGIKAIANVVKRCLAKSPDARFQSMAQLLEALWTSELRSLEPTAGAVPIGITAASRPAVRQSPQWLRNLGAFVGAFASVMVVFALARWAGHRSQRGEAAPTESRAGQSSDRALGEPVDLRAQDRQLLETARAMRILPNQPGGIGTGTASEGPAEPPDEGTVVSPLALPSAPQVARRPGPETTRVPDPSVTEKPTAGDAVSKRPRTRTVVTSDIIDPWASE